MSNLFILTENEAVQNYIYENSELINEVSCHVQDFEEVLKGFVLKNPVEFMGENSIETRKNIEVFSQVATMQYFKEMSAIVASQGTSVINESRYGYSFNCENDSLDNYL